jgi:MFS family permease
MPRFPAPGQAVVSPALDRLADEHPTLAARYPDRLVLGTAGLRGGGELFAYARPPAGRTIAGSHAAIRVREFGPPSTADRAAHGDIPLGLNQLPSRLMIAQGLLALLVVPGLLVLAVGTAVASAVRDRRFAVLGWIGAPPRSLRRLAALETLLLAVPGLAAAALFWAVAAPRLERVPFVGHGAVRGDLGLSWWQVAGLLVAGAATTALTAVFAAATLNRRAARRPRPATGRAAITPLRAAPLGFAIGTWVAWHFVNGINGPILFFAGLAAAVAAVPLLLPIVLRRAGTALARSKSVPALLVGRSLEWDPVRTARPFTALGAIVVLALAASGYFAFLWDSQNPSTPAVNGGSATFNVSWEDPRPNDVANLTTALGTSLVAPIRIADSGDAVVVGASCPQLAPYLGDARCRPDAPYELPAGAVQGLAMLLLYRPDAEVRLVAADDFAGADEAVVLDTAPDLEARVRGAALRLLPAPNIQSTDDVLLRPSPLVAWLAGGLSVALAALATACLLAIVDRLLATRGERDYLLRVGLLPRQLVALEAWRFAAPYGIVLAAGAVVGLTVCAQIVFGAFIGVPWSPIGWSLGLAVLAWVLGTAAVAAFSARSLHERPVAARR